MDKLNLLVILGTNRKLRHSAHVAKWLLAQMQLRAEIQTRLFDVADFNLPPDDYGQEIKTSFPEWRDGIIAAETDGSALPGEPRAYPGYPRFPLDPFRPRCWPSPEPTYRRRPPGAASCGR